MKKSTKLTLSIGALLLGAVAISSCTANFCTPEEKSRMLYRLDPGLYQYESSTTENKVDKNLCYKYESVPGTSDLYRYIIADPNATQKDDDGNEIKFPLYSSKLREIRKNATDNKVVFPSVEYFEWVDQKVLDLAYAKYKASDETITEFANATAEHVYSALEGYGHYKYFQSSGEEVTDEDIWRGYTNINNELAAEHGLEAAASPEFMNIYKRVMNMSIQNYRSCIATIDGNFGAYGDNGKPIKIDKKTWGYAWTRGPIEGLLVYPVAWLVDSLTVAFGGAQSAHGLAQLGALLLVTLFVRLFLFACTFKTTFAQQRMQQLQPELAKLQMKYPNSNTNNAEKQRLAQEQMALYKKNKINPFSQILVMLIQFPVFIGVWGAMTGSAALSTGSLLGLQLSSSISSTLFNVSSLPSNDTGWWTALVLFILMGVAQFVSMKLPQWIQKAKTKNIARLTKNPAVDKQQNTMKWVSWFMLIMIIVMGFTLPAAMGIYWLFGAIISMIQTAIVQAIKPRKHNDKKKVKTVKVRRK